MGFNDVSFYNGGAADGSLQTPHIDSIGRDGVAFTNGYAANAVCAPSRASIMTGSLVLALIAFSGVQTLA